MCIVYAIANQKGGCSKTSVTVNLGVGLAMEGKKVLVIDADPQGSLTISLGYPDPDEIPLTLATVMTDIINENDAKKAAGIAPRPFFIHPLRLTVPRTSQLTIEFMRSHPTDLLFPSPHYIRQKDRDQCSLTDHASH